MPGSVCGIEAAIEQDRHDEEGGRGDELGLERHPRRAAVLPRPPDEEEIEAKKTAVAMP